MRPVPNRASTKDVGVVRNAAVGVRVGRRTRCPVEHAPVGGGRIARDPRLVPDEANAGREPFARREPRDHESVAPVVSGPRDDRHAPGGGPPFAQHPKGLGACALHQIDAGNPDHLDRPAIHLAHVASPVQRGREHRAVRSAGASAALSRAAAARHGRSGARRSIPGCPWSARCSARFSNRSALSGAQRRHSSFRVLTSRLR